MDNEELSAAHAGIVGVGRAGACVRAHAVFVEPPPVFFDSLRRPIIIILEATVTRFRVGNSYFDAQGDQVPATKCTASNADDGC